ncbi:hypothetical protein SNE40_022248 [Patella caerulea]|uniref:Uncharacterized protein n=1 Tax=Patella caerulea TaxID=87958 RepID=A0AAN8FWB3_PATCE
MSKSTETTDKITEAEYHQSGEEKERISTVKQKRKVVRARITRSMNRIRDLIQSNDDNHRRLNRELEEIKRDSFIARDLNSELYAYVSDVATCTLDQWEDELTSDIFDIEEELEDYLNRDAISSQRENEVAEIRNISPPPEQNTTQDQTSPAVEILTSDNQSPQADKVPESPLVMNHSPSWTSPSSEQSHPVSKEKVTSVDSWIDELVEFQETNLPRENQQFTIAESLFKLESSRDIPSIQINKFDGNPLHYVDFIECFQIQIHNKTHLNDNARMSQLKSHLTRTGDAARVLSGMGSQGTMNTTALKTLKQECGQRSVIARAYINKITRGGKVNNDRESLRDCTL